MWGELQEEIALELQLLERLIQTYLPVIQKCTQGNVTVIELSALATMLHSFYSGIENIFKRIAVEVDNKPPKGDEWHKNLLNSMSKLTSTRSAVISEPTHKILKEYLTFRHLFRHAYAFEL